MLSLGRRNFESPSAICRRKRESDAQNPNVTHVGAENEAVDQATMGVGARTRHPNRFSLPFPGGSAPRTTSVRGFPRAQGGTRSKGRGTEGKRRQTIIRSSHQAHPKPTSEYPRESCDPTKLTMTMSRCRPTERNGNVVKGVSSSNERRGKEGSVLALAAPI